jgi:RHH-type rel operon transcriptional repressor/antitoxin RelB
MSACRRWQSEPVVPQPYYIRRQAIETHLEDLGDLYFAQAAMERIRSGESKIISGEEFWRGMDD